MVNDYVDFIFILVRNKLMSKKKDSIKYKVSITTNVFPPTDVNDIDADVAKSTELPKKKKKKKRSLA
jgi:hypothetical protein